MSKLKVLNLYAGIGGNRKLWEDVEVTAVENVDYIADAYAKMYPEDALVREDAHQYLLNHFKEFDFIWSSPPCPTHSKMNTARAGSGMAYRYPDMALWQEIIFLRQFSKAKWVVENVESYYPAVMQPTSFMGRHFFWSNFPIPKIPISSPDRDLTHLRVVDLSGHHDIQLPEGTKDQRKLLRNAVDPHIGLHILKAAQKQTIQEGMVFHEALPSDKGVE